MRPLSIVRKIIFLFLLLEVVLPAKAQITLSSLLDELIDVKREAEFPSPAYKSLLQTSYDRRSILPGTPSWHANDDGVGFIRYEANEGRVEKVLFEDKGPGVITRIITTGKSEGATLRIYFDGAPKASITIPAYDMVQFPLDIPEALLYRHEHYKTTKGSSFYYPLPYNKGCKITVDDLNRNSYYFHANYRRYPSGTSIQTFTLTDAYSQKKHTAEVSAALIHPVTFTESPVFAQQKMNSQGELLLKLPTGTYAVRTLVFNVSNYQPDQYQQLMRGLWVKIAFDGTETVSAPLSDFGGSGMGAPKVNSYYLSADGKGRIIMRFLMPYRKSGQILIKNLTNMKASINITANTSQWQWSPSTLYFHASWRQENGLETNKGTDFQNALLTGRGVFKGDVLSLYNYSKRWYGEGDEHIWLDNEAFPSHFGCGTEDYYNTTFAPIHPYYLPFGGAPREDDEASRGYNTFLRTRNLDVVPFNQNLKLEFELISWDGGKVDYSSTVYWYGDLLSTAKHPSVETDALYELPPAIYTKQQQ